MYKAWLLAVSFSGIQSILHGLVASINILPTISSFVEMSIGSVDLLSMDTKKGQSQFQVSFLGWEWLFNPMSNIFKESMQHSMYEDNREIKKK